MAVRGELFVSVNGVKELHAIDITGLREANIGDFKALIMTYNDLKTRSGGAKLIGTDEGVWASYSFDDIGPSYTSLLTKIGSDSKITFSDDYIEKIIPQDSVIYDGPRLSTQKMNDYMDKFLAAKGDNKEVSKPVYSGPIPRIVDSKEKDKKGIRVFALYDTSKPLDYKKIDLDRVVYFRSGPVERDDDGVIKEASFIKLDPSTNPNMNKAIFSTYTKFLDQTEDMDRDLYRRSVEAEGKLFKSELFTTTEFHDYTFKNGSPGVLTVSFIPATEEAKEHFLSARNLRAGDFVTAFNVHDPNNQELKPIALLARGFSGDEAIQVGDDYYDAGSKDKGNVK